MRVYTILYTASCIPEWLYFSRYLLYYDIESYNLYTVLQKTVSTLKMNINILYAIEVRGVTTTMCLYARKIVIHPSRYLRKVDFYEFIQLDYLVGLSRMAKVHLQYSANPRNE